jgi:hypothetical protein
MRRDGISLAATVVVVLVLLPGAAGMSMPREGLLGLVCSRQECYLCLSALGTACRTRDPMAS